MPSPTYPIQAIRFPGRTHPPLAAARRSCILAGCIALIVTLVLLVAPRPAAAQVVPGEATLNTADGYARLLLKFPVAVDAKAVLTGSVLVVRFNRPVDIAISRINIGATDYIGAARRDPDGRALRFALARKVKLNTFALGERTYIDLLPDSWTAAPPSLPQDVVEDLARRAREAETAARQQAELVAMRKTPAVRVRVATQPTFTRYVFELPDLIGVSTDRGKDDLTLSFAAALRFDFADVKLFSPPAVGSVDASLERGVTAVKFNFAGKVDIRSFREDNNYIVDVTPLEAAAPGSQGKPKQSELPRVIAANGPPGVEAPDTVPAAAGAAAPVEKPADKNAERSSDQAKLAIIAAAPSAQTMPAAVEAMPAAPEPDKTAPHAAATDSPPVPPAAPPAPVVQARAADAPRIDAAGGVSAALRRIGDSLRVRFDFPGPTPAAVFQRADTLWLVFDTPLKVDVAALAGDETRTVRSTSVTQTDDARVIKIKLERARLVSVAAENNSWVVTLGDTATGPGRQMTLTRNSDGSAQAGLKVGFDDPRRVHRLTDTEAGDSLIVVTGLAPARGILRTYDFVEFRILPSTQGLAVQPYADDVAAELGSDKVVLGRPGGLTLSDSMLRDGRGGAARTATFDAQNWSADSLADFGHRQFELLDAAASAPLSGRTNARLDLARFYLAREMYVEAKAVLDVTIADETPNGTNPSALVLRAIANVMLGRNEPALKDLADPLVGNQRATQLWRGLAYARQEKWVEARAAFRQGEGTLGALPSSLQRIALVNDMRAAIEIGDLADAATKLNEMESIGIPSEMAPQVAVLAGRLAQGMGRNDEAMTDYQVAVDSSQGPAAAQGRLRQIALRYARGDTKSPEAVDELEMLTTGWRGDDTEAEALQMLAHLYTKEDRYRDAFRVMRTALVTHPTSTLTRRIHDEAAGTFDALFLAGKGDAMPAIDALSLFYDFRDLTPIGRRGDEMIRRLADRLISVDLLDQAAELLQHQVDNRLQGAARAQVANKLAAVYLLNRKPDRAQAVLRATRTPDLSTDARKQRLLIEARALSDGGRHDLALEVIAHIEGKEAIRLRADIQWAARRWQQGAEQLELLHADSAGGFEPLSELARSDILRAAIGYAISDDTLGMSRLQEKFGAKMADSPDRHAFEVVSGGLGVNSVEFGEVARRVAAIDTLDGFLRDLNIRFPESTAVSAATPSPAGGAASPAKSEATGAILPRRPSQRPLRTSAR